ncbi:MAG: SigB/SigF/SigG family RNA polymerase sigma factor [Geodermatophilaceae bacterium]|nr:SigB/SigF/SigG family RNA polymerase sigma factor [Geodermatophilaceae bacterium]
MSTDVVAGGPGVPPVHPLLEVAGDDDVRRRFLELRDPETGEERRSVVRDELVEMFVPMAQRVARRFRNRNEPVEDLGQVALLGLLKAVDGFDPERSVSFSSYAIPTMLGEIKRHFRDKGWSLHVPRRLKELSLNVVSATGDLTQQLGRHPTDADLSAVLGVSECEIREARLCVRAYHCTSLSTPHPLQESTSDRFGVVDPGMQRVEDVQTLRPLLAALPPRERKIIALRFGGNLTQSQIAGRLGISQMHVSRLLTKCLGQLRQGLLADG